MNKTNKIPKRRFPEFTDAWEVQKLEEVAEINPKSALPDEFEYVDLESVVGTEMIAHRTEYKNSAPSRAQRLAQKGDIFYQTVRPYQKNNYLFELNAGDKNFVFSTGYAQLRPSISSHFLFSCIQEENFVRKVLDKCTGTSYPAINANDLSKIRVCIPTNPAEQTAIGNFFGKIDRLIALNEQKLEHTQKLKKGLLQKMFPQNGQNIPEIRFPQFTDDWELHKLGEISEKVKEKNKNREFTETLTNSAEFGVISQRDFFDKEISNIDNIDNYYIVQNDDFIYNPRISNLAPVGPIKRNKLGRTGVMSPLYYIFRLNSDVEPSYLESYFETKIWHNFMYLNGDTGARSDRFAIKDSIFVQMPIMLPSIAEQTAIGDFFRRLDGLITLHQRKLEHLKQLKKSLLQQMFV
ncbi:restriction endonuclease subunit S [Neisseria yangbaofengii]|uniref:restriction endonuclease subunit S n=2 Tax=Neisseria yangbaofengii TaxID=2709396 RepID=UPI003B9E48F8